MEASQKDKAHNPSPFSIPQNPISSIRDPDFFTFLQQKEKPSKPSSFFSENGLSQDIIQVTQAEPDICLEVFYALYHSLWPQIEKQSNFSLKDAWTRFIGSSVYKGSLCPPEKLITERRIRDIRKSLSETEGEGRVFRDLDHVVNSIVNLKQKIEHHPEEIFEKKRVIASLILTQNLYLQYRNKVKALVQTILQKELANIPHISELEELEDLLEPKAVMMSDIFANHWAYRIPRNQAQKILSIDVFGRNIKNNNHNDPSNHRVIALPENTDEPLVFFKANGSPPIQPEKEFMLNSLYQHLQIPVPETALLILTDVFEASPEYFYAVQASEAVLGESSLKACQDPETPFDHEAYVSQVLGAFLTNPSDGSFKNFKYSPEYKTFISIDNDEVFQPEIIGSNNKKIANVKSMLYLLPQIDLPVPESILTFYATLDPHLTTYAWLQNLSRKNREYQLLFTRLAFQRTRCIYQSLLPQNDVPPLSKCLQQKVRVNSELHGDSFKPQILVSQNLFITLTEKFRTIEKILLKNRSVSTQMLFEEISPLLGKYYRKLRHEFSDSEEALEALWGNKKNGVDYSEISSLLDNQDFPNSSDHNSSIPPETFLEEYREQLLSTDQESLPLDKFIRRHQERRKKNVLNLRIALSELRLLVQENLTSSQSPRDIVDFFHSFPKLTESDQQLIKEIIFILSNLPHAELKWLLSLEKYFIRTDRPIPNSSKVSSVEVLGAFMKKRTFHLTGSERQYLFDQQQNIKKNSSFTGRSLVTCFPQQNSEFFLKQYPEWPGYEFASTLFMRLLGVERLPHQDLLIINDYPVLLTQKAPGDPVICIWNDPHAFSNLDPFHTALLILSAMLINPEDGKEDNFILSPEKRFLIPIDNDHCFLPSNFQKEGSFWNAFTVNTALQTKTILFCLDEMNKPIPLEVKQHVLSLNFDELLIEWMTELDKIENRLNNLVDKNLRSQFLQQGTVMRIPFYKQFIHNIYWKAHKIQDILKTTPQPTSFDLLKAVEPFAAKCYQESFKQGNSLQNRFKSATHQLYTKTTTDGSRVSILNTRTMMEIINVSEKDLQDDAIFQRMGPLDALELLNQLVQERSQKARIEQEILCELDEKNQEKSWISLFGNSSVESNLKAFFANPKEGLSLKGSKLVTSSKLAELFTQTPDTGMRIRFLSVPESPLLANKEMRIITAECPNLEYLNVSGCEKLTKIITAEGEWPLLARLEAKDCLSLKKFVSYSPMKILRLGTEQDIEILVAKSTLDIFTISKKNINFEFSFKKDENLEIKSQGQVLSNNDFLFKVMRGEEETEKYFRNFKITMKMHSILSGKNLEVFVTFLHLKNSNLMSQNLQEITQLNLKNLKMLDLSKNKRIRIEGLRYLIQGNWPKLEHLDLSENEIHNEGVEILIQGKWSFLKTLNLSDAQIDFLGVEIIVKQSNWPQLRSLDLSDNEINDEAVQILAQGNWPLLETLNLLKTSVTKRVLPCFLLHTNWPNFQKITLPESWRSSETNLASNFIKKDLSQVSKLELNYCEIFFNDIEKIFEKIKCPRLKYLNLSEKEISLEGISVFTNADCPLLEELHLENTKITWEGIELIVNQSKWPQLKHFNLSNNAVFCNEKNSALSSAEWPLMENLNLSNTNLCPIKIEAIVHKSNWPMLKHLDISRNEISDSGVSLLVLANWSALESLNLSSTMLSLQGIDGIVQKSKWPQLLKHINLSNNDLFDEGLSTLSLAEWPLLEQLHLKNTKITTQGIQILVYQISLPNLKTLNISENSIFDEGLKMLTSGNWPLFQNLSYSQTKVTPEGHIALLENLQWPDFHHLEHSFSESFYNNGNSKYLLAAFPMDGLFIVILNATWFNSEEISLTINHDNSSEKITLLPRDKLDQFESIESPLDSSRLILWPPNLKRLVVTSSNLSHKLEKLPLLESLYIASIKLTAQGLETLIQNTQIPSNLKKLDISSNPIQNEGLEILASANWPKLESLNLASTFITAQGIKSLANPQKWPNLKELDISHNSIRNEGLEILGSIKWPLLEFLHIASTKILAQGLQALINGLDPSIFKKLDISSNRIQNEGLEILASAKWPLFELLDITVTDITARGLELFIKKANWPNLKQIAVSLNAVPDEGVEILVTAKWPLLESLKFQSSYMGPLGVGTLVGKSNWPNLKKLDLSCRISKTGQRALSFGKWPLLESLSLHSTEGIKSLMKRAEWPNLKTLDVSFSENVSFDNLTPERWPLLEVLNLTRTKVTIKDVETLIKNSSWQNLKEIIFHEVIQDSDEQNAVRKLLSAKWPKVKVKF